MKLSLFNQTESRMRLKPPRTEKRCGQKRDAQSPLVDVLIHLYQYTDHCWPDQPAVGAPPFGRDKYCVMLHAETLWVFQSFPWKNSGTERRRNF